MTQRIPDNVVEMIVNPTAPLAAQQAGIDLLSLRAAVRRWRDAKGEYRRLVADYANHDVYAIGEAFNAMVYAESQLLAEMGGIDKEGKPTAQSETHCAKCGKPKNDHPYRHPFVGIDKDGGA